MVDLLIIIPRASFKVWLESNMYRINSIQLGTQRGVMLDGRRFKYTVAEDDWLERLRGIRFRDYEATGANLNSLQVSAIQSMMQLS